MKELEYTLPEKIEGTDQKMISNPFKGKLVIKVPKYKERLELVRKLGFTANSESINIKHSASNCVNSFISNLYPISDNTFLALYS